MSLVTIHKSAVTAIGSVATVTGIDMSKPHCFIGIKFFSDSLGRYEATPTAGRLSFAIKTVNTDRFIPQGDQIYAGVPTTLSWTANTEEVQVTPHDVNVAAYYQVVVTANETGDGKVSRPIDVALPEAQGDAFGRLRISPTDTLFDSKMLSDDLPLFWDDQQISGASTTSTYNQDRAGVTLGVAATTAGRRIRQTFQRFNYQPGKSQLIYMTGVPILSGGGDGIVARMGYYDDDNGIIFGVEDGTPTFTLRSSLTGSPVDTAVEQSDWNQDSMDGTGPSGFTLDTTKSIILYIDFEWLGVGVVRCGFVIDGKLIIAHKFLNTNNVAGVYMSTPNLPLRYELVNDGTGAATTMEQICSTVVSEGGQDERAQLRAVMTNEAVVSPSANTWCALLGIRLKSTALARTIDLSKVSVISGSTDDFQWGLWFNPTVAGTFTYSNQDDSAVQTAIGAATNTLTNGTLIAGGVVRSTGQGANAGAGLDAEIDAALRLGATISGTPDELILAGYSYGASADFDAAMNWRERT